VRDANGFASLVGKQFQLPVMTRDKNIGVFTLTPIIADGQAGFFSCMTELKASILGLVPGPEQNHCRLFPAACAMPRNNNHESSSN
jgi:hypothetical protein